MLSPDGVQHPKLLNLYILRSPFSEQFLDNLRLYCWLFYILSLACICSCSSLPSNSLSNKSFLSITCSNRWIIVNGSDNSFPEIPSHSIRHLICGTWIRIQWRHQSFSMRRKYPCRQMPNPLNPQSSWGFQKECRLRAFGTTLINFQRRW
jgi:hypothetical protein